MDHKKENALSDFLYSISTSWTFNRLTDSEKNACREAFSSSTARNISGSYSQRWNAFDALYYAFLLGVGYTGPYWREPTTGEPVPF